MDKKEYVRLDFQPGIVSNSTQYATEGGWFDGDKVRFYGGKPRAIGGWINVNGVQSSATYDGITRGLHSWTDYTGNSYVAIGTHKRLQVWDRSQTFIDITPIRLTQALTNNFNTSSGSAEVLISATGHGGSNNDIIAIVSATISIGNTIVLSSAGTSTEYTAIVSSANIVRVCVVSAATSTLAGGGGTAQLVWYLPVGRQHNQLGTGWGAGAYGVSSWGTERGSGVLQILRTWSLDTWGQTLVAAPKGGSLYQWGLNTNSRASVITAAPSIIDYMFVSPEDQHLICLGTHDTGGTYNPLLVRWCSQANLNDWATSATNTAGSKTLSGKGKLISGIRTPNQMLLFTDNALYAMTFIGPPLTFGFSFLGDGCGLVAPHAAVVVDGRVYWMSQESFFMYDGGIVPLTCPVRDKVFGMINAQQKTKVWAARNSRFHEVLFFYQSTDATEIDRYVSFNYIDNAWAYGTLARTAWIDQDILSNPVAAGTDGKLYYHESGVSADGGPLSNFIESGFIDIKDGTDIMFVDRFIPDFNVTTGQTNITLKFAKYPNSTPVQKTFTTNAQTLSKGVRGRGRHMAIRVSSNGAWIYGSPRVRVKTDGEN